MTPPPRRVLGIDPGTRLCGWGLVDVQGPALRHVDNGVVVLGESAPLAARLSTLFEQLDRIIAEHRPDAAACEGIFQHRNARSALILGHARGVALAVMARAGLSVKEYTPMQIKKAVCGHGRAGKLQVQQMVAMRLDLNEIPQEDAADAVAVAVCHGQHLAFGDQPTPRIPKPPRHRRGRAALAAFAGDDPLGNVPLPGGHAAFAALSAGAPALPTPASSKVRIIHPRPRRDSSDEDS